jgi:hypothetical protein
VSSAPTPVAQRQASPHAASPGEACPLCGAPLHPQQEWCLRCGAAARTRLARSPNWRVPLVGALVVAVLSLGVLAAALVKLSGGSGSIATPSTSTLSGASTASAPTASTATTPASTPGATTPGAAPPRTAPPASTKTPTGTAPSQAAPGAGKHLTPLERLEQLRRQGTRIGK